MERERELGAQVRALRRTRGLTQQQSADRANVSVGAVKNLESGAGSTVRTLVRVLRALDADDWLSTVPVPRPTFNPLDVPGPPPVAAGREAHAPVGGAP